MSCIDQWLIVGGRRWARIIANELCAMLAPNATIMLLGDPKDIDFLNWWKSNPHKEQLKIVDQIESCCLPKIGVAIVANSAYLHHSSIETALDARYNVISEKPLTLSKLESSTLLGKAKKLGLKLFSANTYLFADYLRVFQKNCLSGKKISHLDIQWADPIVETRYGERKRYDSSIPIIYDVLPHVASIVMATYGEVNIIKSSIKVSKGGNEVELRIACEDLMITISLARDSLSRKRLIRFSGIELDVTLEFTEEPGVVSFAGQSPVICDLDWTSKRKPIAEMLYCVKNYFEEGIMDDRLCSDAALLGNELIDSVANDYVDQQISYLNLEYQPQIQIIHDLNLAYAARESISLKKRVIQYLSKDSPLRRLALEPSQCFEQSIY